MEYSIQKLEKSKVEIALSVEGEEWTACIKEVYNQNKHQYKMEGFRPGKVPFNVLVKRYGVEVFFEDAIDYALNKYYGEILDKEKELEVIARPDVDIKAIDSDCMKAVLTVATYPEFELGQYTGLEIKKVVAKVKKEEIDAEITRVQEANCRWVDVTDRAVENGDKIILDYSGAIDGVKFEGGTAEKQPLDIGSGQFIPGFEEQLIGVKIGETKEVKVTFPQEYHAVDLAGKEAIFTCTVHEIKFKELPALDDEFAKDVSEFDTFAEYKASIKAKLTEAAKEKARYEEENKLVETLVKNTQIDIPDALIEDELDRMLAELEGRMSMYGLRFEDYLKYTGTTVEALKKERREDAVSSVHSRLVLEAIIKKENLNVTPEEFNAEIENLAKEADKDVEEYKKTLNQQMAASVMNKIMSDKLFDFLRKNNTIA